MKKFRVIKVADNFETHYEIEEKSWIWGWSPLVYYTETSDFSKPYKFKTLLEAYTYLDQAYQKSRIVVKEIKMPDDRFKMFDG